MRSVRSLFLMESARVGSLNAFDQARPRDPTRGWLGGPPPSADALGDAAAALSLDDLREALFQEYTVLKRNKAIRPLPYGFLVLILDAHECGASYLRKSEGSLIRMVKTAGGERPQYYYRYVTAMLLHAQGQLLLDLEPLRPGEDEIAAAQRLFVRVEERYPRAFDTVAGDSLYLNPGFWKLVDQHGKYFLAVLKNENRDLVVDARSLLPDTPSVRWREGHTDIEAWDIPDLTTWPQYGKPVRVVRTIETHPVRRQRTKEVEVQKTEWLWATNIPQTKAPRKILVGLGHGRWTIENQGFNEIVNTWHGDHIYKNNLHAIVACLLLLFLAYNLFHAFFARDLKPELRAAHTRAFFAEKIRSAFYEAIPAHGRGRPP